MKASWEWRCRELELENKKYLAREEVADHPLKPKMMVVVGGSSSTSRGQGSSVASTTSSSSSPQVMDPLGASLDGSDPLSQFVDSYDPLTTISSTKSRSDKWDIKEKKTRHSSRKKTENICDDTEPWFISRAAILNEFTTTEKLSMTSSFLSGGERVMSKAKSLTVRTRLEQLDDFEEGVREEGGLTQQQYTIRIEQLNTELGQAWNDDQRVKALKIAIQCSKLLVDTSVIHFYPSKFVLITDILDNFGRLVFERLAAKSENTNWPGNRCLTSEFEPDIVPESAKETCRNWFYKISSIRELVPRLYVEAAILKCYSFLDKGELVQAVMRLTRMVRGIGDPLVAVYARCYLCRVGSTVNNLEKQLFKENFYDFLNSYHQVYQSVNFDPEKQKLELASYLTLYTPALEWMLQSLANNAPVSLLDEILARCEKQANRSLLLNSIMSAFKSAYIAPRATRFVKLIATCNEEKGFPQHLLYRSLGLCLSVSAPDDTQEVWDHVWCYMCYLRNPHHYMACAEVWLPFILQYCSSQEVDILLHAIITHLTPNRLYEQFYPQLQEMASNLLSYTTDLVSLFMMEKFMPFLDIIQNDNVKVAVCKNIMTQFAAKMAPTNDPVVIDALISICLVLHDSVNALTVDDEKRQISQLISQLVLRVDHGRNFEQQLMFCVDARSVFSGLDTVHATLVQRVNKLAVETERVVKGHHTRKTSAFVRACVAYCYITVPSILSVTTRLQLYLLSAQVALANQCLGQVDACLKDALSLVVEMPAQFEVDGKLKSSEQFLVSYLCQLLSLLIVVPDSPEQGVLYLTRGLLNILQHYTWDATSSARARVYLCSLNMLSAAAQERYPYHVKKVDSNDVLYGSDPKFISEINKMCSLIIEELLIQLQAFESANMLQEQATFALDLCVTIMTRGDLSCPGLPTLASNLWSVSNKHQMLSFKLLKNTLEHLKRRGSRYSNSIFTKTISKFTLSKQTFER